MTADELRLIVSKMLPILDDAELLLSAYELSGGVGGNHQYWFDEYKKVLQKAEECLDGVSNENLRFVVYVLENRMEFSSSRYVYAFLLKYLDDRATPYPEGRASV